MNNNREKLKTVSLIFPLERVMGSAHTFKAHGESSLRKLPASPSDAMGEFRESITHFSTARMDLRWDGLPPMDFQIGQRGRSLPLCGRLILQIVPPV